MGLRVMKMIPLHVADQAVANCEKEIQELRARVVELEKVVRRDREYIQDQVLEIIALRKQLEEARR